DDDAFVLFEMRRDDLDELRVRFHLACRWIRPDNRDVDGFGHVPIVELLFGPDIDVNRTSVAVQNVSCLFGVDIFDAHARHYSLAQSGSCMSTVSTQRSNLNPTPRRTPECWKPSFS